MKDIAIVSFFLILVFGSTDWIFGAVVSAVVFVVSGTIAYGRFYDKTDFSKIPRSWWGGL